MTDGPVAEFEARRPRLFALAYRLLGSAEEAEDTVQDAYLRWDAADRTTIAAPTAWLTKVITNLALNRLTAARTRRERYVGPWLPEPVITSGGALGPLETAEQRETVSMALLLLLERLTPTERAVFVLREAFGHPYRDIAAILDHTEANCRQLHRRATSRIREDRTRFRPEPEQWHRLVERFLRAASDGNLPALERLLAHDVTSWSDGGGKAISARRPIVGRDRVAHFYGHGLPRQVNDVDIAIVEINGVPAVLATRDNTPVGVVVPEIDAGQLTTLRVVVNPDKLRYLQRQLAEPPEPPPHLSHSRGPSGS